MGLHPVRGVVAGTGWVICQRYCDFFITGMGYFPQSADDPDVPQATPGPVQPVDQALGRQQRGLHPADMGRDIAGQRIHAALAAGAPEERIERQARRGRRAVGGAGGLGRQVGEQRRLGVQQERQLIVEPGRVELRGPGDVEANRLRGSRDRAMRRSN